MSNFNEELLERLQRVWEAYKFQIIVVVLMILSAIAGLSYQSVATNRARQAAGDALFTVMQMATESEFAAAETALARIDADAFPQLRNLALVALAAAGAEDADAQLREAAATESDEGLQMLLILRRVEVLINNGDTDAALALLEEHEANTNPAMQMLFAERRGDAHYVAGRPRAARDAYIQARTAASEIFQSHLPALNLKIGASVSLPPGAVVAKSESDADSDAAQDSSSQ